MKQIKLNESEFSYICQATFLPEKLRSLFSKVQKQGASYLLKISENEADQIRDLCGEHLQIVGFDEKYDLTPEGEVLEALVDKFFIG